MADERLREEVGEHRGRRPSRKDDQHREPRRAVVLGGGGVLGFAWMVGALSALEVEAAFDVRGADLLLGTSAGSVAAALLGCGTAVDEIRRHHQGAQAPHDPPIAYQYDASSGLPPRPGLRFGSPRLVFGAVRHPRRSSPVVTLSAVLPPGRGTLGPVRGMVSSLAAETGDRWPEPTAMDRGDGLPQRAASRLRA